jgi:hypothetical protein
MEREERKMRERKMNVRLQRIAAREQKVAA